MPAGAWHPQHSRREQALMATLVNQTVLGWGIVVEGAPVRCASCDHAILGSGEGPARVLLEAATRHLAESHGLAGELEIEDTGVEADPVRVTASRHGDSPRRRPRGLLDALWPARGGVRRRELANQALVERLLRALAEDPEVQELVRARRRRRRRRWLHLVERASG